MLTLLQLLFYVTIIVAVVLVVVFSIIVTAGNALAYVVDGGTIYIVVASALVPKLAITFQRRYLIYLYFINFLVHFCTFHFIKFI